MGTQKEKPNPLLIETVKSQILLTYGIMTAIYIVSIMTLLGIHGSIDEAQALSLLLSAFAPTTITYIGAFIIDNRFAISNKTTASWFIIYIAILSLLYAAFESIKLATTSQNDVASPEPVVKTVASGEWVIRLMALISMVVAVISLWHIFRVTSRAMESPNQDKHKLADGSICAKRRVLW